MIKNRNNKNNKKQKRLIIEVPESFHKLVKNKANNLGISIRLYVIRALIEKDRHDN